MRKVLLATTALVAVTGVTAANADISISGNIEWEYVSQDTGTTFKDDSSLTIKAVNAADNGVTFTAVTSIGGGSDRATGATNGTGAGFENVYIQASGDFGTLYLGDVDGNSAISLMDGALGRNKDIETDQGMGTADTAIFLDGQADIIYMTPSFGGLKLGFGVDLTDADAVASDGAADVGLTYSMSGINLYAGTTSGQTNDESNFGVSTSIAGLNIGVGSRSVNDSQAKASDIGVNYTLGNGIKVAALSGKGTDAAGASVTNSNVGLSYTIVPGVKFNAESGKVAEADYTWAPSVVSSAIG
jgi:hypothetical protein